jgi:hypothetical protein
MNLADLRLAVRSETGSEEDDQLPDDQMAIRFWISYGQLRRKLTARFPELFIVTDDTQTLTGASDSLTKPTGFGGLERIEKLCGTKWITVPHAPAMDPHVACYLGFREEGAEFKLSGPNDSVPGDYRIVYKTAPATCFPAGDVPRGFEDIIIQEVTAWAQRRLGGDPQPHLDLAAKIYKEQARALVIARHAAAPLPGFTPGYGAGAE